MILPSNLWYAAAYWLPATRRDNAQHTTTTLKDGRNNAPQSVNAYRRSASSCFLRCIFAAIFWSSVRCGAAVATGTSSSEACADNTSELRAIHSELSIALAKEQTLT